MNKKISRRQLLMILAGATGTAGLVWARHLMATLATRNVLPLDGTQTYLPYMSRQFTPTSTSTPTATRTPTQTASPTPTPSRTGTATRTPTATNTPSSGQPQVVHMHSGSATNWVDQTDYWNHVNQSQVNDMVDRGVMELTNTSTRADAWRALIHNYAPGKAIAIKVNFNNTINGGCSDSDSQIDALIQPVNAMLRGLKDIGVTEADIWVYDAVRAIPQRFVSGCLYSGVKFFNGVTSCNNQAMFSPTKITFSPPGGTHPLPDEYIPQLLLDASYLINMPILKNHDCGSVTLGFKNHFGSISNPGGLHDYIFVNPAPGCEKAYFTTAYSPLVDIYRDPNIGGKTVLTLADALFACRGSEAGSPSTWSTFDGQVPNSLLLATDPVAIDCVMCDLLAAEPGAGVMTNADNYLKLAHAASLGVFERGDPWAPGGSGYSLIDYRKIEL